MKQLIFHRMRGLWGPFFQPLGDGLVVKGIGNQAGAPILESIAVTPDAQTIDDGGTLQFTATGTYDDASTADLTALVTWESDDTDVATLDVAGLATGTGPGQATISATLGAISGNTTLDVSAVPLWSRDLTTLDLGDGATSGRTSEGYHQQPTGSWVSIASGAPRFYGANWTGSAWNKTGATGPYGLLMEPLDTNHWFPSNMLNWLIQVGGSPTDSGIASPYGTNYAKYTPTTANTTHLCYITKKTLPGNNAAVARFSAKASGYGYLYFEIHDGAQDATRAIGLSINLTTGAVAASYYKAVTSFEATLQADGYWLFEIGIPTLTTADRGPVLSFTPTAINARTTWFAGDGTSGGHVQGAVLTNIEDSSFIATVAAAASRAPDTLSYIPGPTSNETRIIKRLVSDPATEVIVDIDDWDYVVPAPTVPQFIQRIDVYAPGQRPA